MRKSQDITKYLQKNTSDKELLSKTYKEHLKLTNKKTNHLVSKWVKDLNKHLTKEDIQLENKHMKICSKSYIIRER